MVHTDFVEDGSMAHSKGGFMNVSVSVTSGRGVFYDKELACQVPCNHVIRPFSSSKPRLQEDPTAHLFRRLEKSKNQLLYRCGKMPRRRCGSDTARGVFVGILMP